MLVKDEFFAEEPIEQSDDEEQVGRISGMNDVEAMTEQHLQAQPGRYEHGEAIFQDVGSVFVWASQQFVSIHMNVINIDIRVLVLDARSHFRADGTHLVALLL